MTSQTSNDRSTLKSLWMSVDSGTTTKAMKRTRHNRRRLAVQCIVIASLSLFVAGVVVTGASFGPLLKPSRHLPVVITLQVLGLSLLAVTGTVWVSGAVLFYKWKRRIKRRQRAALLRNRVQLHALATDVLNRRPQPGDILAPADRQQLLDQLRLFDACEKEYDSVMTKSSSTLGLSDARRSSTCDAMTAQTTYFNGTSLLNEKCENKDFTREDGENKEDQRATKMSRGPQLLDAANVPGIFISRFDPSDVEDYACDVFTYNRPRIRCESYSGGSDRRCTLMVRQAAGSGFSSGTSIFASQRSLPSSSKGSLRLGDSGWEGDISHDGSLSTVSQRDWAGGPANEMVENSSSINYLFLPLTPHKRRHSTSNADQISDKSSSWICNGPRHTHNSKNHCMACYHSVKSGITGRHSSIEANCLTSHTFCGQALDVYSNISSSRSFNESKRLTVHENNAQRGSTRVRRRLMTSPTTRRPRRRRKATRRVAGGADISAVQISDRHQHTDDSDVERRVERVFYEIDNSVTDSVDESKIQSPEYEFRSD